MKEAYIRKEVDDKSADGGRVGCGLMKIGVEEVCNSPGLYKRQLVHLSQDRPYGPVVIEVNQQEKGTPPIG
ncbi:hypothetical protein HPB49_003872 [Dermacentor silvarum]|uniref:Uncharacterized protein n=1 Tax=Dermacentor silvarum TaxID=543639 RepID=A0ACB8C0U3_DERSI|nr:hypothetical protein HPB49_003872 [Dermacentor silvarum]